VQKTGRAQNTVKRGRFWPCRVVGGKGSGPSLLRRGEKRLWQGHGQGAPGRIKGLPPLAADPSTVKGTSHWWYPSKWYACTLKPVGRRLRIVPQTNTLGDCKACYVYMCLFVHLWCSRMFVMQCNALQCNAMEWNSMVWYYGMFFFLNVHIVESHYDKQQT